MEEITLNHKYVLVTPIIGDVIIRYSDLKNTQYTRYIYHTPLAPKNRVLAFLFRIHQSKAINEIVNLPFKNVWKNNNYLPDLDKDFINFRPSLPYCFIIYARYFQRLSKHRDAYIQYLRTKYKNCKIVLYFSDPVKNHSDFDIMMYEQSFDAIYTYDKDDASEYNYVCYEDQLFSSCNIKKNLRLPESDVVYIGQAKRRLGEILKAYETLSSNNLICDFHVVGAPKAEQRYRDKIHYHRFPISYEKNLQHVLSSKCILEILIDGSTARVSEAIYYGKKILSNDQSLEFKSYYNPEYISIFQSAESLDIGFVKKNIESIDYKYKENLSPLHLIEHIDKHFANINT